MADPGFPAGWHEPIRGHGLPMQALFSENVSKNTELGPVGGHTPGTPPRSANE